MNIVTHKEWSDKYLRKEIQALRYVESQEDIDNLCKEKGLQPAFMQHMVRDREIEEGDVAKFADKINKAYDMGIIEEAVYMNSISSMKLMDESVVYNYAFDSSKDITEENTLWKKLKMPNRTLIMFYSFSKLSIEKQKEFNAQMFHHEGELIDDKN